MDDLRRTGRTKRMLSEARKLAEQGKAVYVVAATEQHALQLEFEAGEEATKLGIKFETIGSLRNLDFETLTLRGAHPNCVVLVDHYAIECRFSRVLEMLHKFDNHAAQHGADRAAVSDQNRKRQPMNEEHDDER